MEILEEWIAGRGKCPVTWNTLIEVLHDIELSTLAREIAAVKLPADVEDRPTEDTEDSTVSDITLNTLTEILHNIELSTSAREIEVVRSVVKTDVLKTLKIQIRELSVEFLNIQEYLTVHKQPFTEIHLVCVHAAS